MAGNVEEVEFEEGEILDSDEDDDKKTTETGAVQMGDDSAVSKPVSFTQPRGDPFPMSARLPPASYRQGQSSVLSSSDEDDNSDVNDDSDDDNVVIGGKKRRIRNIPSNGNRSAPFINPLLQQRSADHGRNNLSHFQNTNPSAVAKKKGSNIWGAILQEQSMERDINSIGMEQIDRERDVESYNFQNARRDTRTPPPTVSGSSDYESETDKKDELDICAIETFAQGDTKKPKAKPKSVKDRLDLNHPHWDCSLDSIIRQNKYENEADEKESQKRGHKRTYMHHDEPLDDVEMSERSDVKDRLGKKNAMFRLGERKEREKFIEVEPTDSKAIIVNALVENLLEHNVELMVRVVENLGPELSVELMYETEDIENSGGMMTFDGSRRRTPGGVFLQLVKSHKSVTKDQKKKIFYEEKVKESKRRKELRKVHEKNRREMMVGRMSRDNLGTLVKGDGKPDEDRTAAVDSEMDTGDVVKTPNQEDEASNPDGTEEAKRVPSPPPEPAPIEDEFDMYAEADIEIFG